MNKDLFEMYVFNYILKIKHCKSVKLRILAREESIAEEILSIHKQMTKGIGEWKKRLFRPIRKVYVDKPPYELEEYQKEYARNMAGERQKALDEFDKTKVSN